jgi:hypothetical protein
MVISQIMGDAQSQLGHGPEALAVRFLFLGADEKSQEWIGRGWCMG